MGNQRDGWVIREMGGCKRDGLLSRNMDRTAERWVDKHKDRWLNIVMGG